MRITFQPLVAASWLGFLILVAALTGEPKCVVAGAVGWVFGSLRVTWGEQ